MKFTTKVAHSVFPSYVWSVLILESRLTVCRWANRWLPWRRQIIEQLRQGRELKIHLGCGSRIIPGWVNVDGIGSDGVDLQWDLRYPLPFEDSSARMIYSEHLLEHLMKEDAVKLMRECYRILESTGKIRIGVPDGELYLRAYAEDRRHFFKEVEHLGGAVVALATPIDVVNQMFRMGGHHQFAWDFVALSEALQSVGFVAVSRWNGGQASSVGICLDDPAHAFETLYVEASKLVLR